MKEKSPILLISKLAPCNQKTALTSKKRPLSSQDLWRELFQHFCHQTDPKDIEIGSSSSDSGNPHSPSSDDLRSLLEEPDAFSWDVKVTRYISKRSGVMYVPVQIASMLSPSKETIRLHDNATNQSYKCTLRSTKRSRNEKYITRATWVSYFKAKKLQVADLLKLEIRSSPLTIFVDIIRKSGKTN